ncbi:MAG TPA: HlyD family secretion protein [Pyrinomonadaceae bacterium]|nr:HlyD family secretion protein [Pyrinomonadaceae bacterium]
MNEDKEFGNNPDKLSASSNLEASHQTDQQIGGPATNEPESSSAAAPAGQSSAEPRPNIQNDKNNNTNGKNGNRRFARIAIVIGILAILAATAYWLYSRQYESTDDAFVDGDIIEVSPKVSAHVAKVYVRSNQFVHKGDLLLELDPTDFEAKLEQAKAQLELAKSNQHAAEAALGLTKKTTQASRMQASSGVNTAKANVRQTQLASESKSNALRQAEAAVKTAEANLAAAKAQLPEAESNRRLAEKEYNRRLTLYNRGDISQQALDQARNALDAASANLSALQKQVSAAEARLEEAKAAADASRSNYKQTLAQIELSQSQVNETIGKLADADAAPQRIEVSATQLDSARAQVEAAEAELHQAELNLSYTKIYAPDDGYVTKKTVEPGQLVAAGEPLLAISRSQEVWVTANFKETQLELMKPGQSVDIYIDAYPNHVFHGTVESIQAGTGARFSLLPPENATGNYVKVVQRVPVKILLESQPQDVFLAPGMSAVPYVKVR